MKNAILILLLTSCCAMGQKTVNSVVTFKGIPVLTSAYYMGRTAVIPKDTLLSYAPDLLYAEIQPITVKKKKVYQQTWQSHQRNGKYTQICVNDTILGTLFRFNKSQTTLMGDLTSIRIALTGWHNKDLARNRLYELRLIGEAQGGFEKYGLIYSVNEKQ
jgi:hypothetical protein